MSGVYRSNPGCQFKMSHQRNSNSAVEAILFKLVIVERLSDCLMKQYYLNVSLSIGCQVSHNQIMANDFTELFKTLFCSITQNV